MAIWKKSRKENAANGNNGELREKEVMRISLLLETEKSDEGEVSYKTKGICKAVALQAIASVLYNEFDMIPVPAPKENFGRIIVCGGSEEDFKNFVSSMKDEEDGNGEGDGTDAEGEDSE